MQPIWVSKITRNYLWIALIAALPWIFGSSYVWQGTNEALILPLSIDAFDFPMQILFNHRYVMNIHLLHGALISLTFMPTVLLLICLGIFYYATPNPLRYSLPLLLLSFFYTAGAPGISPNQISDLFISFLILIPLFRMPPAILLWGFGSFLVLVSALHKEYQFPLLWLTFSLMTSFLLNFLLADRGILSMRVRTQIPRYFLQFSALFFLAFWIILSIMEMPPEWSFLQPSENFLLAWLIVGLCVFLSWHRPWESTRWLSLVIFAQGVYLSKTMDRLMIWMIIGLGVEVLLVPPALKIYQRVPQFLKLSFRPVLALVALSLMIQQVWNFKPERTFNDGWISLLRQIKLGETSGYLVVGRGLPFLAHFVPQDLVKDDEALLKTTEKDLKSLMDHYQVSDILVDKSYLNEFWLKWIQSGKSPQLANHSVISRAIAYKGQAIDTPTLKIPALKDFTQIPLKDISDYVWLRKN